MGFIAKKGEPVVTIEKEISKYVASKAKLARLNSLVQTGSQQHK